MRRITHYEQRLRTLHYKKKFTIWLAEIRPKVRVPAKIYCRLFPEKKYENLKFVCEKILFFLFSGRNSWLFLLRFMLRSRENLLFLISQYFSKKFYKEYRNH
jgi:hypothetical protein